MKMAGMSSGQAIEAPDTLLRKIVARAGTVADATYERFREKFWWVKIIGLSAQGWAGRRPPPVFLFNDINSLA